MLHQAMPKGEKRYMIFYSAEKGKRGGNAKKNATFTRKIWQNSMQGRGEKGNKGKLGGGQ